MKRNTRAVFAQLSLHEVVALANEGSRAAFSYLCEVVHRCALSYSTKLCREWNEGIDPMDAAQSVTELFLRRGPRMLARFEKKGAWLKKFVRDGVIGHFRATSRARTLESRAALEDQGSSDDFERMDKQVAARSLRRVFDLCEDDKKIADALSMGFTYRQIARVMGISATSVYERVRLWRARVETHLNENLDLLEMVA